MELTDLEKMRAAAAVKDLHEIANKTEDTGLIRAMAALHENAKRYAEKHHPEVIVYAGDT